MNLIMKPLLIFHTCAFLYILNTQSQTWDSQFFEMELPSSWRRITPLENNTKPAIQNDTINIYIMIMLTQLHNGG